MESVTFDSITLRQTITTGSALTVNYSMRSGGLYSPAPGH
jgi:hypothetical protein